MSQSHRDKQFISEQALIEDAFRLGVAIYNSGFRPTFIVGLWRGGSAVGIYVQECLQHLGVATDHIAIRTSYSGMDDYSNMIAQADSRIRVHGTQYLLESLNADDRLLIVDDVYSSGLTIDAVIGRLTQRLKRNMPSDIKVASIWSRAGTAQKQPDYYLHQTKQWLVLPYELKGLSKAEIAEHKSFMVPILDSVEQV